MLNIKKGFTLAEVLLTLVIIGVIAAICMQSLFANYFRQEVASKTKKAYSTMARGIMLSQMDNGPVDEWYGTVENRAPDYFNVFFRPYFQISRTCTDAANCGYKNPPTPWVYLNNTVYNWYLTNERQSRFYFYLMDGTFVAIKTGSYPCAEYDDDGNCIRNQLTFDIEPTVIIDINGPKGPNKLGRDVFLMQISAEKGIVPYCYTSSLASVNNNCKKAEAEAAALLKL